MKDQKDPPKKEALQEILRCTEDKRFEQALEELVRTFQDDIYGYCFGRLGNNHTRTEEVAQEVFIAAWKALPKARLAYGEESIAPWIYAIAKYKILDDRTKHSREKEDPGLEEEEIPGTDPQEPTISELDLKRALMKLRPDHREVLLWRAQGFSAKEIAEFLEEDITEEGVRVRIFRARKALRKVLDNG